MLITLNSSKVFIHGFLFVALIFVPGLLKADGVAKVVSLSGKVTMNTKTENSVVLNTNSDIPAGAVVVTGAGAVAKLLFTDDTIMDLGPDTKFRIDEFKDSGGGERTGVFSLAYGTLRSLVAKPVSKGDYKVKTKDAIMGVRGTEFVVTSPFIGAGTTPTPNLATNIVVASGTVSVAASAASGGAVGGAGFTAPTMSVAAGQSFSAAQLPTATAVAAGGGAASSQSSGASSGSPGSTATAAGSTGASTSQPQKVDAAQMTSIMGSARVSDSTFTKAITVGGGDASSSSSSSDSASGGGGDTGAAGGPAGGTTGGSAGGGSLIMGNVMGAVTTNIAQGGAAMLPQMGTMNFAPTGISINDVISAPPILQLPGQLRNITIIIQ